MPCCTAAGAGLVLSGDLLNIAYDTWLFGDERVRLHAADALLAAGRGPRRYGHRRSFSSFPLTRTAKSETLPVTKG